jgi:hypothetical protein
LSQNKTITANFLASPLSGKAPLTVQFTDTSSGDPTSWQWDFNSDGKWNALPKRKTGEDGHYMYFESKTPGFSPFAIITGIKAVEYKENESEESTEPLDLPIGSSQSKVPETAPWAVKRLKIKTGQELPLPSRFLPGLW